MPFQIVRNDISKVKADDIITGYMIACALTFVYVQILISIALIKKSSMVQLNKKRLSARNFMITIDKTSCLWYNITIDTTLS